MGRRIALGLVAVASVAACVFLVVVGVLGGLGQAVLWAAPLGAVTGMVAAAAAVWALLARPAQSTAPPAVPLAVVARPVLARSAVPPAPPAPENPGWWVRRPAELAAVVDALTDGKATTVGITTGLYGAGGFGKTTLALMACADQQVRDLFGDRVYPVTLGRDLRAWRR